MPLQRITHAGAAPPTNLLSAITATAMSFGLTSSTGYPTGSGGPFVLDIDPGQPTEEKVLCSSLSGGTVTVATGGRGWDGTIAVAHSPGTALAPNVTHIFSTNEADDANAHIYTPSRDDHTQYALASGGRAVGASVKSSVGLAIVANTTTILAFDTVTWGSGYNTSTFTYTVSATGLYLMQAAIAYLPGASLAAVHNGSIVAAGAPAETGTEPFGAAQFNHAYISYFLEATVGDTLWFELRSPNAGTIISDGARVYGQYLQLH